MKLLLSCLLLVAISSFGAVPDYKAFRGTGGIIITTNPPNGTIVIDGSGIASPTGGVSAASATNIVLANSSRVAPPISSVQFNSNGVMQGTPSGSLAFTNGLLRGNGYGLSNVTGVELFFDVQRDFGAAGDGVTDDTVAIQAAIDAATGNTNQGTTAVVYFRQGKYLIGGSTINSSAAQLTIKPSALPVVAYSTIVFRGPGYIANSDGSGSTGASGTNGAVFISTAPSNSVIRAKFGTLNLNFPVFEHLTIQIPTNAPVTALNLWEFAWCKVDDVNINCGFGTLATPLPHTNSIGVLLPKVYGGDRILLNDVNVCGLGVAIGASEHMDATAVNINGCLIGFKFYYGEHASYIGRACIQATQYPLYWQGTNPVVISCLSLEHEDGAFAPHWQTNLADVYDPTNQGLGLVTFNTGVAYQPGVFARLTKVGGTNVFCSEIGFPTPEFNLSTNVALLNRGVQNFIGATNSFAGRVGVGTTGPLNKLSVGAGTVDSANGGIVLKQTGPDDGIAAQASISDAFILMRHNGVTATINSTYMATGGYTPITFLSGGAERLRINTNGAFGIGTTNPVDLLEINDADKTVLSLYDDANLRIMSTNALAINKGGSISMGGVGLSAGSVKYGFASLKGSKENSNDGDISGYLSLYTTRAAVGSVERVRVTSSGNVGIGTPAPSSSLDLTGGVRAISAIFTNGITFNEGAGGNALILGGWGNGIGFSNTVTGGLSLYTADIASGNEWYIGGGGLSAARVSVSNSVIWGTTTAGSAAITKTNGHAKVTSGNGSLTGATNALWFQGVNTFTQATNAIINQQAGKVNMTVGHAFYYVTNNLVTTNSILLATLNSSPDSERLVAAVPMDGVFRLELSAAWSTTPGGNISWFIVAP